MISSVIAAMAFSSAPARPDASALIQKSWDRTHVVGHRGAAAYEPENTLISFAKAVEVGAHATECDVHMSKDGVAMVMHDTTLERTTRLTGKVAETDSSTMIQAGIPTLEDYIVDLKGKIVQVIEIKAGVGVVPEVLRLVRKHKTERETIIFSFNADFIKESKTLAPDVIAIWLVGAATNEGNLGEVLARRADIKADGLGFQFRQVQSFLAERLRAEKLPLFVWTVPPGEQSERLNGLKVNFIITDHPKDVLGALKF